ncbi:hypothetical protein Tco_1193148 [Tanacetum coccineum]
MATPIDFSKYVLNGLKIENLTQDILLGPAFNLLKGTCSSSIELDYNFQECFNALTDKLDWDNPEGDRYPFDLSKPLLLQGPPEITYTTSITKTKAARYEIKGIEDMVPTLWSTIKHAYDKDAEKGIKHSGERRKLWYRSQVSKFSKQNVYSTQAIIGVKSVSVKKLHGYGHLEEIVVKRYNQQLYKFKEGDFVDLHLNDIEDMLLLAVQHKLFHLDGSVIVDFIVALRMFTRSLILKRHVEDLQLGKRVLRADELYKFSDGTLKSVRDEIHHRVLDFRLDYNPETVINRKRSGLMIELIDKDQVSILAKDKGFGQEMHQSEESKALYGVTSPKDYAVTYSNKEMSHHTLYGVKCLQDYAATFKYTRDDVSESALRRNICGRVMP